jgi:hypothetical protein
MTISSHSSIYSSVFNSINHKTNDTQTMQKISELQSIDTKVRAHEMAHQAVGGGFAGAPSYTLQKGPDGKDYAVAGEVPIKIEKGKTPEETIANMQQIKAAALAPADPSPQDLRVAQNADMIASEAKQQENQNNSNDNNLNNQHIDIYA